MLQHAFLFLSFAAPLAAHANHCAVPVEAAHFACEDSSPMGVMDKGLDSLMTKLAGGQDSPVISVFETTATDTKVSSLVPRPSLRFAAPNPADEGIGTFDFDPDKKFQTMEGFGGNFTEACAINLMRLPKQQRREVLEKVFSKTKGAGFDLMRLPLGASDFTDRVKGSYSYSDTPGNVPDPEFKHFNMKRDEKTFALLREAQEINPNLKIMVSPWSAPAWMKTSKELHGGKLAPEHYQDYANYFVKVIQEYQKRGLNIQSLTMQNEPFYQTAAYPSMEVSTEEQAAFIRDYLGPTMAKHNLQKMLFVHDHNWSGSEGVNDLLADKDVKKYAAGVAYHCYGGQRWGMWDTYNSHPDMRVLQTECTGTTESKHARHDLNWWLENQSVAPMEMGVIGSLGWNLCLDDKSGPVLGEDNPKFGYATCKNCRGLLTTDFSKKKAVVSYNPEFHALAQVSKFIVPGARRIDTKGTVEGIYVTGFQNPDQSMVVVGHNSTQSPQKIRVRGPNCQLFVYELPAGGAVTFSWKN